MAPLPQNNTARVFFDYVTGSAATSQEHTVAFRVASSQSTDAAQSAAFNVIVAAGAGQFWNGWRVIRVRYQAAGSTFSSVLTPITAVANFIGTGGVAPSAEREAIEVTFQGRSQSTGRRVDFSLYGFIVTPGPNFRYTVGGNGTPSTVDDVVTALNGGDAEVLTIDGSSATWYPYINVQYNSYWERRLRTV